MVDGHFYNFVSQKICGKGFRFARRLPSWQQSHDSDDDWLLVYHSLDGGVMIAAWTTASYTHTAGCVDWGWGIFMNKFWGDNVPIVRLRSTQLPAYYASLASRRDSVSHTFYLFFFSLKNLKKYVFH